MDRPQDTGSTIEHEDALAQDEEEELTDLSVDMECDSDSKQEEEERREEISEDEEEEPKNEDKSKEQEDRRPGDDEEFHEADVVDKQRKNRLNCHDCGKSFTRRETYDLHRHFHMHQDEQASLTCKECGLTFQHRSSLIKHRSEHKQNGVPDSALVSYKRSQVREFREEKIFECDHCGDCFASLIRFKLHACQQSLEKPYRCPLCRKEFQYRVSINAHMQSHSLECPYRCLECNKGFQCAVTLHIHQRSHAALKPYECPDCGMVFRHRSFMEDHRRKHTEERPHRCTICGKTFKYGSLLQQHQYLHTGQKPYRCTECGKRFAFAQNMRAHCRQHKKLTSSGFEAAITESNEMSNGTSLGSIGKENTNTYMEHQRNCPLCPQLFYKAADLRAHILTHEAEYEKLSNGKKNHKAYACPNCPLQFLDESTLQSHALTHQVIAIPSKREVLTVASSASTDNITADGEWGDQTDKKPLRCKDCGKSFRYRSVLELHMRIHNRGYQCHVCKKSFRFSSYLQQHLIIHSGKKPYKCPDCGKDFAFLQNMKTHQRLHQQKPFRCTQCRKGYSDESQLQRHMLCHSGDKPHKCHICNKSFGLAYLLRDHLNTHTGERPHRCQECHKSFPWLSSLLVHQKIHARKRQGTNQSYPSTTGSQRGRTSAVGRGRRSGRWVSSWPRMGGNVDRAVPLQPAPFQDQILQTVPNLLGQESNVFESDRNEQTQLMPVLQQQWQIQIHSQLQQHSKWLSEGQSNNFRNQWQTATHLKPILPKPDVLPKIASQQQSPGWAEVASSCQAGTGPKQLPENYTAQNNCDTASTSTLSPARGCADGPSKSEAKVQQQPPPSPGTADRSLVRKTRSMSNAQNSPNKGLNIQGQQLSQWPASDIAQNTNMGIGSSGKENVITFSLKTPAGTQQVHTESDKSDPSQQLPTQTRQNADALDDSATLKNNSKPLNIGTPLEMSKSVNSQEKTVNETGAQHPQLHILPPTSQQQHQQLQLVLQPQTNPLGSVSVQFGAAPFSHGNGSTVLGFQTTPVVSQALLNGPVQQGPQQQAPLVSASQILLNQAPPFFTSPLPLASPLALSGPHPIHSIAGQLPGPAPQSIIFSPQGIVNEKPVIPQALPSTHGSQRTEPNKVIGQVSLTADQRFRCMICGGTLPGELELQVHYMQHVQGEV